MGWNGFHRRAPVDLPATVERGHASSLAAIINKELRRGRKERKNRQQETRKKKNRFGIERRKKLTGGRGLQREDAKRCGSDHQFSQHFIDRLTELYYSSWWEPTAATAERSPPFIMTTRTSVGFHRMRKKKKKKRKKKQGENCQNSADANDERIRHVVHPHEKEDTQRDEGIKGLQKPSRVAYGIIYSPIILQVTTLLVQLSPSFTLSLYYSCRHRDTCWTLLLQQYSQRPALYSS